MFYSSNKLTEKLFLKALRIFYRFDYEDTLLLRRAYVAFDRFKTDINKWIRYGKCDIFDTVTIETTTLCNRSCAHCPNSIYDRGKQENLMSENLFRKIINELKEINFSGTLAPHFYGEPLLDKRLPQLMAYAHNNLPRAKLAIFTNGDFLDTETLNILYETGVRNFLITIHSHPDKGIIRVNKLMQYVRQTKKRIRIMCQIIDKKTPLSTRTGLIRGKNNRYVEYACGDPLTINYKGEVLLCCNDYLGKAPMGNVNNEKLIDIWNSVSFKALRKELRSGEFSLEICKSCSGQE